MEVAVLGRDPVGLQVVGQIRCQVLGVSSSSGRCH